MTYTRERLGEILVNSGLVSMEDMSAALAEQLRLGGKLGQILVDMGVASEEQIADTLALQKGYEYVDLTTYRVDRSAASLLPARVALMRHVVPIELRDGALVLAMADPLDIETADEVEVRTGYRVVPVVASPSHIRYAIEKYISAADAFQGVVDAVEDAESVRAEADTQVLVGGEDVPIVRLVNQLIREAVLERASDIHIEPGISGVRVRYRVDGVLHEVMSLPLAARAGITSRIKIMAEMDIAERRRPQDGKIALRIEERPIDLRVAGVPTPFGESLVIRILNAEFSFHSLTDLGMNTTHLETLSDLLTRPYGALLVSGPTGSGKSTTMYAALQKLNDPSRKIITIEEPVEYQMTGVTQIGVNTKIGLTFASGLRTVLRSDPDIVMVGEIRDPETAEIAIRAALTGHLVLSSIHTNDAPSALTRLVDMGVPTYITGSSLLGVIAQRLARKLCEACKRPVKLDAAEIAAAGFDKREAADLTVYEPVGCAQCGDSGYRGRMGLFEVMHIDESLTRLFMTNAPADQLRTLAIKRGMVTLRRDALDKVAAGHTSLAEVARVVM
ncbi:MAG: Flp pilus assembly complex ATPase component TadA [Clostridiales bacterium]|nr:Flp pilus assembly complex ATPase component TadA [Clostridiales bacterium]